MRTKVLLVTLGGATIVLSLAAYLSTRSETHAVRGGLVTYQAVISRFEEASGDTLSLDEEYSTDAVQQLDLEGNAGLFPSPGNRKKYGRFSVLVFASSPERRIYQYLGVGRNAEPDARGIFWVQSDGVWLAFRRQSKNVLLAWYDAPARGRTDERWSRLDSALQGLP